MQILGLKPGEGGYRVLFWTLVALLVLRPVIEEFARFPWMLPLFFTIALLASVWTVSKNRRHVIVVAVLALFAVAGEWTRLADIGFNEVFSRAAGVLAFAWVAAVLAQDVFREREYVSGDMIYGGINIYLLVIVAFALAYQVQISLVPDSFIGLSADLGISEELYFSVVTITTLGYGDILPVSGNARMLAATEAIFGQLFIAVLLAKLVATHISGTPGNDRPS